MLESFIITLATELELDEVPKKDPLNQFFLKLNSEQTLILKEQEEGILLRAQIGPLPEQRQEELCLLLMKGNFLGQGTGKSVIGLQENEKCLTLSTILPYDMDYRAFKLSTEEFANYLAYWQAELFNFL